MRALVLLGPHRAEVRDVPVPIPGPEQVVVDVAAVGFCGTDVAFLTGEQPYLATGQASYPLRPGHEWAGVVSAVGAGADEALLGRRVTGDTMLGCQHCDRCRDGRQHVCADRFEIGVLGGWHGAVAEQLLVPFFALHSLPDAVTDTAGAMVEPGANACRAVQAARVAPGTGIAIFGAGTIGLLAAAFAKAAGADVQVIGRSPAGLALAAELGVRSATLADVRQQQLTFDAVLDCSDGADVPSAALDLVEPAGTVIFVGLSGLPSTVDSRQAVLKDLTLQGHLSGSPAMAATVAAYSSGAVDPVRLVAATVGLDDAPQALAGWRPDGAGAGTKMHIDPRR